VRGKASQPAMSRSLDEASIRITLIVLLASPVWVDKRENLADRFLQHIAGQAANTPRLSHTPVEALDLIREYRAFDTEPLREQHLEGISLDLRGDGAAEGQPHAAIV
jgi:hypothetical protein